MNLEEKISKPNVMSLILFSDEDENTLDGFPFYYAFGFNNDIHTFEEYEQVFESDTLLHKSARKRAERIVSTLKGSGEEIEFHHFPHLGLL